MSLAVRPPKMALEFRKPSTQNKISDIGEGFLVLCILCSVNGPVTVEEAVTAHVVE